eukprot:scaffold2490_cov169-Amphora_coffeaeformis.AAC.13
MVDKKTPRMRSEVFGSSRSLRELWSEVEVCCVDVSFGGTTNLPLGSFFRLKHGRHTPNSKKAHNIITILRHDYGHTT